MWRGHAVQREPNIWWTYHLCLLGERISQTRNQQKQVAYSSALKIKAGCSSETLASLWTAWCCNHLCTYCHKNLKSSITEYILHALAPNVLFPELLCICCSPSVLHVLVSLPHHFISSISYSCDSLSLLPIKITLYIRTVSRWPASG